MSPYIIYPTTRVQPFELISRIRILALLLSILTLNSQQKSVSGREVSEGRVLDDEMEVQESAVSAVSFSSEFDFDSSADGEVINHTNFTDFETGSQVPSETMNTSVLNSIQEDTIIIEQSMAPSIQYS